MKHIILIAFSITTIFGSCGKKCNVNSPASYSLDSSLTAYFGIYKTGSYWVYQNQNQTKSDSIYVTFYSRGFILDRPVCETDETLLMTLKSTGKNIIASDSVCMQGNANYILTQNCTSSIFGDATVTELDFFPDSVSGSNTISTFSSVTLNSKVYKGPAGSMCAVYCSDTIYMQKRVGIIGWKKNGQTYNLVRQYLHP